LPSSTGTLIDSSTDSEVALSVANTSPGATDTGNARDNAALAFTSICGTFVRCLSKNVL